MKKPRRSGASRSRPVSRILSRVAIHLCGYPAPRRAASAEPVRLAPDGVWRAGDAATAAGGLLPHRFTLTVSVSGDALSAVCFLCHCPSAFAASLTGASCPAVSGLSSSPGGPAVTRPATRILPGLPRNRGARGGRCRIPGSGWRRPRAGRTPRTPGIRATPRAATRRAPAPASGAGARRSQFPEHPHDLAEDLDVVGVDRLERAVLRLETDAAVLAEEALHCRLVGRLVVAR